MFGLGSGYKPAPQQLPQDRSRIPLLVLGHLAGVQEIQLFMGLLL
jgi:hypothetical protein